MDSNLVLVLESF